jgi:allophanate hydrolase
MSPLSLDFRSLSRAYAQGVVRPRQVVEEVYRRIAARGDDFVWLHLRPMADVLAQADALGARRANGEALPLFGLPYGVKDNIDVAGLPTSAACTAFTYTADRSAAVVEKLDAAGALLIGKQNMDQFATGLVGVRNVGGRHCVNSFDARYIPGGSSSGSAVSVAVGSTSFSIGSDTGGSGRVPAALNNLVGLKPTPGLVSSRGFVYCNRSFDVPPVFALTVGDAQAVLHVIAGPDAEDVYSRPAPPATVDGTLPSTFRFAMPQASQLEFFGDTQASAQFERALDHLMAMGGEPFEVDFEPFLEAGRMVFNSALVAERWLSYGDTVKRAPETVHPAVKTAIEAATGYSAADAYATAYRLRELQREVWHVLGGAACLVVPTAGTIYTCEQVAADPMRLNAHMGHYTYFANPLRLAAISVPAGLRDDGLPFGVSLIGLPWSDARIASLAAAFHARVGGALGATPWQLSDALG